MFSGSNCETVSASKKIIQNTVTFATILCIVIIVSFYVTVILFDFDKIYKGLRKKNFEKKLKREGDKNEANPKKYEKEGKMKKTKPVKLVYHP
jgi:uncharacterized membrane protein YciS (DUF1049 family)